MLLYYSLLQNNLPSAVCYRLFSLQDALLTSDYEPFSGQNKFNELANKFVAGSDVTFCFGMSIYAYICFTIYIQMGKSYLGEFEELVLTMVGVLGEEAYGNAIVSEIRERMGREVNLSAVHVTLYRLEDKGYVKSSMGGATATRGGRRKRYFTITNAGLSMLHAIQEKRMELWKLLPQLKFS